MTIILLTAIIVLSLCLQLRKLKLPLHQDTGQHLYRPFFESLGYKFKPQPREERFADLLFALRAPQGYYLKTGSYIPVWQEIALYYLLRPIYAVSKNPRAFRICFAIYNCLTAMMIFLIGYSLFSPEAGLIGALLYAVYSALPMFDSHQIHIEHYTIFPICLAVVLLLCAGENHAILLPFLTGFLLCSIVLFFKITFALDCAAIAFLPLILFNNPGHIPIILLGGMSCFIMFTLLFWYKKVLRFFIHSLNIICHIKYTREVIAGHVSKKIFTNPIKDKGPLLIVLTSQLALIGYGVLFHFFSAVNQHLENGTIFLSVWLCTSFSAMLIQRKFYFSHFIPLLLPLSLLAGEGLSKSWDYMLDLFKAGHLFTASALLVFASCAVIALIVSSWRYLFICAADQYQLSFYSLLKHPHTLRFIAAEVIASYVKKHSIPEDRIIVWGYNSELYALANRRGAGKGEVVCIDDPLQSGVVGTEAWIQYFIDGIKENRPKFIIDFYGTLSVSVLKEHAGMSYRLDSLFFSLFPVYILEQDSVSGSPGYPTLQQLSRGEMFVNVDGKDTPLHHFIMVVTHEYINGNLKRVDFLTKSNISAMIQEWRTLQGIS